MIIEFIPKEAFIFILFLDLTLAAWYLSGSGTLIRDFLIHSFFLSYKSLSTHLPFRN
jgi:hypothetical protein